MFPSLDGIEESVKKDMTDYIFARTATPSLYCKLQTSGSLGRQNKNILAKLNNFLVTKSHGCFLYVKLILDMIDKGNLTVKSSSFKVFPQNLFEIYQLAFNLKFGSNDSFVQVSEILSICLASLAPLSLNQVQR